MKLMTVLYKIRLRRRDDPFYKKPSKILSHEESLRETWGIWGKWGKCWDIIKGNDVICGRCCDMREMLGHRGNFETWLKNLGTWEKHWDMRENLGLIGNFGSWGTSWLILTDAICIYVRLPPKKVNHFCLTLDLAPRQIYVWKHVLCNWFVVISL